MIEGIAVKGMRLPDSTFILSLTALLIPHDDVITIAKFTIPLNPMKDQVITEVNPALKL